MSALQKDRSRLVAGIAQIGALGMFLVQILRAIPASLRHIGEMARQVWFVGAMSLVIIMTCGLFVGMVRRVALARAIVRDPMLIIYDEPFVGLDPIALNQILLLIRTLNDTLGITSILVAHELSAVRRAADQIYLIAGGKIAAHGDPETLARGETPWTRQFFSGEADGPVPFQYPAQDYARQLGFAGTQA